MKLPSPRKMTLKGTTLAGSHAGYLVWDPESTLPELKYLAEEWAFPEHKVGAHAHQHHEFHLQLSGASEWVVDGVKTVLTANMMIAVAPHQSHTMRSVSSHSQHFIYSSIALAAGFARCGLPRHEAFGEQPFILVRDAEPFVAPFRSLSHEVTQDRPHRSILFQHAFESIIYLLDRVAEAPGQESEYASMIEDRLIYGIKTYIDTHLSNKLCIDDLVKKLGVSRSVLFQAMKRELGVTPLSYHAARRIELAKSMLRTESLPLTNIALDLGYSSSQHFSSAFRKAEGISPSFYRQKIGRPGNQ